MNIKDKYIKDLEKDTVSNLVVDTLEVVFKYNTEHLGKFLEITDKTNIRIERISGTYYIYIDTVDGEEMFLENQYLVKDSKGNFYIYNKEDFEKTFELGDVEK